MYAGTEFGIYISFDNGERWRSFQMNLPATTVPDIRVAHKDLKGDKANFGCLRRS
jgi:hypothetical protein